MHAGLAPRTVYLRFATKADLLQRCVGVAIAGDAEPGAIADRSWMADAITAPTLDERIQRMASITAKLMGRAGPLLAVAQQAAATEPVIAAAVQAGRDDTRCTIAEFWMRTAEDGLLPPGCDLGWLTDTATLLAHAGTYLLLTKTTARDITTFRGGCGGRGRQDRTYAAALRISDLEKEAQMDRSCARTGSVQAGVTVGRSRRLVQRLELRDQRRHVLTHLYLSEEDADRAVRVDEEVCTQSAGPADAAALRSLCLHGHAKTPSHAIPKPREEAVRGLARRRHLVPGHLL